METVIIIKSEGPTKQMSIEPANENLKIRKKPSFKQRRRAFSAGKSLFRIKTLDNRLTMASSLEQCKSKTPGHEDSIEQLSTMRFILYILIGS